MNLEKILLVVNPKSGKAKALKDKEKIKKVLSLDNSFVSYETRGFEDKEQIKIICEKESVKTVIVCGGDGTLNLCINATRDLNLRFIFLPYGTVNIFAKEHLYPKNNIEALEEILKNGKEKIIYEGMLREKSFVLMSSIGFDSYLVRKVETNARKFRMLSYFFAFLKYAFKYRFSKTYSLSVNNKTYKGHFIVISNCKKYGGFLKFTPDASFFKKEFDALVFNGKGFFLLLVLMIRTFFQKHLKWKRVQILKAENFVLEGDGVCQVDGEIGEKLTLKINSGKGVRFVLP